MLVVGSIERIHIVEDSPSGWSKNIYALEIEGNSTQFSFFYFFIFPETKHKIFVFQIQKRFS